MGSLTEVTDATFEQEVLSSELPVLVDFWSAGCGPCLRLAPVLEELAGDNAGKLKIVKANVEQTMGTAGQYGVSMLPTLVIIKGGEVVERIIGAKAKSDLQAAIDAAIA